MEKMWTHCLSCLFLNEKNEFYTTNCHLYTLGNIMLNDVIFMSVDSNNRTNGNNNFSNYDKITSH